jgi:hypothetical protein
LLLIFMGLCLFGSAQLIVEDMEYVSKTEKNKHRFPNVVSKTKPAAADSINETMRRDIFFTDEEFLPPIDTLFVRSSTYDIGPLLYDIDYKVLLNKSNLFSIAISADGCGAYCEYFTRYYNFDATTGHLLVPEELFTPDGVQFISDSMTLSKQLRVAHQLKELQAVQATFSSQTDSALVEENSSAIQMYEQCVEGRVTLEYIEYVIRDDEIEFTSDRCSPHAIRALDEIGDFHFPFKISSLKKYLTPYGKKLLLAN